MWIFNAAVCLGIMLIWRVLSAWGARPPGRGNGTSPQFGVSAGVWGQGATGLADGYRLSLANSPSGARESASPMMARAGPPTITAAAAALLMTDRRRHVPPRTPAPPRKQLSSSALARVSYGGACVAATAASRDDICETSSAEAERHATLSLILSGVAGLARLQQWPRPCNARHSS